MQRVWILKNSRKYTGKVCEFRGVFSLFLFIFQPVRANMWPHSFFLNRYKKPLIVQFKNGVSDWTDPIRNGQSPVCSRCIVIGQYSVERQRTLYGVAGTETRGRRLRNTWKSCMKRNIMRNPCKLYFCFLFFFFTLARSKCYRTIIIHRLEVIMGVHSLVGCVWETICDLE